MRIISLTEEERQELKLLHKTSSSALVRERSFTLLLSDSGQYINQIVLTMRRSRRTVSDLLTLWEHRGTTAAADLLGMAKGRGAKIKLAPVKDLLHELVEKHSRNLKPILAILEKEYSVKVSKQTLQNFLKEAWI
jgi:transposase